MLHLLLFSFLGQIAHKSNFKERSGSGAGWGELAHWVKVLATCLLNLNPETNIVEIEIDLEVVSNFHTHMYTQYMNKLKNYFKRKEGGRRICFGRGSKMQPVMVGKTAAGTWSKTGSWYSVPPPRFCAVKIPARGVVLPTLGLSLVTDVIWSSPHTCACPEVCFHGESESSRQSR